MTEQQYTHYQREDIIWDSPLSKELKITLLALNSYVGADGRCWPGNKVLAQKVSVKVSTLRGYLTDLEKIGAITRIRRKRKDGGESSSEKVVDFEAIKSLTPAAESAPPPCQPASTPLLTSQHDPLLENQHPPADQPATELSIETIQERTVYLTTTERPNKKAKKESSSKCARTPFKASGDDGALNQASQSADFVIEKLTYTAGLDPIMKTARLVSACDGKSDLELYMAMCAFLEAAQDGDVKVNQGYIESAIAGRWVPSPPYIYKTNFFDAEHISYAERRWKEQREQKARMYEELEKVEVTA